MKTSTKTLIGAMRKLAQDIDSEDGLANMAIAEAADRLEELDKRAVALRGALVPLLVDDRDIDINIEKAIRQIYTATKNLHGLTPDQNNRVAAMEVLIAYPEEV